MSGKTPYYQPNYQPTPQELWECGLEKGKTNCTIADPASVIGEGNRSFQGYREGKYVLPDDGWEQNRMDLQHKIWLLIFGDRLNLAPIYKPQHVLDVATGTGIWALDFAEKHPYASVTGTDLSLIQPPDKRNLKNVQFWREDAEEVWVHDHKFDFVHLRTSVGSFYDHRTVIRNAYDNMNPGGWIEMKDFVWDPIDYNGAYQGTTLQLELQITIQGMHALGQDPMKARYYRQWLVEAGFEDVVERRIEVPVGGWPEDAHSYWIGLFLQVDCFAGIESASPKTHAAVGIGEDQRRDLVEAAKTDLTNPNLKLAIPLVCRKEHFGPKRKVSLSTRLYAYLGNGPDYDAVVTTKQPKVNNRKFRIYKNGTPECKTRNGQLRI